MPTMEQKDSFMANASASKFAFARYNHLSIQRAELYTKGLGETHSLLEK